MRGRAPLVGPRLDPGAPAGFVSPIEARCNLGLDYQDLSGEEKLALAHRSVTRDAAVVLKALVSRVAASPERGSVRRTKVLVSPVDNLDVEEALELLFAEPQGRARLFHFVHPHAVNVACRDAALRDCLARADGVFADGIGMRLAAKLLRTPLKNNLNGTDMLPLVCDLAASKRVPLSLVGGAPGVAEACAARLEANHPGLEVPLVRHGFMTEDETRALVDSMKDLGRVLVLVGMGSPLQERWSHANLASLPSVTALTVGGLFDFFSGRMPRAPQLVRDLGLEWAFRLRQEPRRMAKRYILGNPLFLARVMRQRLRDSGPLHA